MIFSHDVDAQMLAKKEDDAMAQAGAYDLAIDGPMLDAEIAYAAVCEQEARRITNALDSDNMAYDRAADEALIDSFVG